MLSMVLLKLTSDRAGVALMEPKLYFLNVRRHILSLFGVRYIENVSLYKPRS